MRLTEQEYWENEYKERSIDVGTQNKSISFYRRVADITKKLLGKKVTSMTKSYDEYLLFDVILPKCLPDVRTGMNAIEIGCAPGTHIMKFAGTYGLTPHGVEYTASGAKISKTNFERHGYDHENVHFADFLSVEFQTEHSNKYDVVVSRGFIEHFIDPENIISAHMTLLKPGGNLIISIPNLRGIYWLWTYLFNKPQLPLHNLAIMRLNKFRKLFETSKLQRQWCNYLGTFSFWLFTAEKPGALLKSIMRMMIIAQMVLNVLFRLFFRNTGFETAWFSPNLLYIGRKCE